MFWNIHSITEIKCCSFKNKRGTNNNNNNYIIQPLAGTIIIKKKIKSKSVMY